MDVLIRSVLCAVIAGTLGCKPLSAEIAAITAASPPFGTAWSNDGSLLWIGADGPLVQDGSMRDDFTVWSAVPIAARGRLAPTGGFVYARNPDGLAIFDLEGNFVGAPSYGDGRAIAGTLFVPSADGCSLLSSDVVGSTSEHPLALLDIGGVGTAATKALLAKDAGVESAAFSPEGRELLLVIDGVLREMDLSQLATPFVLNQSVAIDVDPGHVKRAVFWPTGGNPLVVVDNDDGGTSTETIDLATGEATVLWNDKTPWIGNASLDHTHMARTNEGRYLFAAVPDGLVLYRFDSQDASRVWSSGRALIALSLRDDGTRLAVADTSTRIEVFSVDRLVSGGRQ